MLSGSADRDLSDVGPVGEADPRSWFTDSAVGTVVGPVLALAGRRRVAREA